MDATRSEDSHGYEDEPREYFSPLPEHLAPLYYDLCSSADTSDVCYFYDQLRFNGCRHVLELGCGTGRISSHLVAKELTVVGVDICRPMLAHPRHRPSTVVAMDMRALGFTRSFEAAIIGCNTLNLLVTKEQIGLCLSQVYKILTGPALLLLQLFVPDRLLLHNPETGFFQASVHDMGDGGKLVKKSSAPTAPPSRIYSIRNATSSDTPRPLNRTSIITSSRRLPPSHHKPGSTCSQTPDSRYSAAMAAGRQPHFSKATAPPCI